MVLDSRVTPERPLGPTACAVPATSCSSRAAGLQPRRAGHDRGGRRVALARRHHGDRGGRGLLLADRYAAALVVGVGLHATLEEFLDRQRAGPASSYLTRLKVGARLVDAKAVPTLYSGQRRGPNVVPVLVAGLVALLAAIAITPVGQDWAHDVVDYLQAHL